MFKGLGLIDTIILVTATGFFFIGISQIILVGFVGSYWLFMLTFVLLMWFQRRKAGKKIQEEENELKQQKSTKKHKKK